MHLPSDKKIEAQARAYVAASYKPDPTWLFQYNRAWDLHQTYKPLWEQVMSKCPGGDKCNCKEHELYIHVTTMAQEVNRLYQQNIAEISRRVAEWRSALIRARSAKRVRLLLRQSTIKDGKPLYPGNITSIAHLPRRYKQVPNTPLY